MSDLLKGKVAVITGGTRGIGYAIVRQFVMEGANVALCGSKESTAKAASEKLLSEFSRAEVLPLYPNLSSPESMSEALKAVKERFGRVDVLVNNAGIAQSDSLYEYTEEAIDKILNLNIKSVVVCAQAAAKVMKEQGRGGVIINTSSVVSLYGQARGCCYPASKFAVNGITKSLARELAADGIRVNAVAPGITKTDMVASLPDAMIQPLINTIPLHRIGEPEDIANAVVFLSSDKASYITGAVLSVDGGVII